MKLSLVHILVGLLVVVAVVYLLFKKEGFMSPGTMDQLSSTRVSYYRQPYLLY